MVVLALAAAVLISTIVALVIPRQRVLPAAVLVCLGVLAVFGNNSVPRLLWVGSFLFSGFIAAIAVLRRPSVGTGRPSWTFWAITAAWTWLAVGVILTHSSSISRIILYAGLCVTLAALGARLDPDGRRLVFHGILWVALGETVVGVATLVAGAKPLWGYRGAMDPTNHLFAGTIDRVQGTLGHPIVFGLVIGVAAIIAWTNTIRLRRGIRVLWLTVLAAGLVLSGTRSAIAAVIAAILVHLVVRGRLGAWVRNVIVASALAGILAIMDFGVSARIQTLVQSGSWTHRLASIESVPALLGRPPFDTWFGHGFGSEVQLFTSGLIPLTFGLPVVDDFWVYLLGTTGIAGLAVVVGAFVIALGRGDRQGIAILVFIIGMGFSFDLFVWLFAGVLVSLLLPLTERLEGRSDARPSRREVLGAHQTSNREDSLGQLDDASSPATEEAPRHLQPADSLPQ